MDYSKADGHEGHVSFSNPHDDLDFSTSDEPDPLLQLQHELNQWGINIDAEPDIKLPSPPVAEVAMPVAYSPPSTPVKIQTKARPKSMVVERYHEPSSPPMRSPGIINLLKSKFGSPYRITGGNQITKKGQNRKFAYFWLKNKGAKHHEKYFEQVPNKSTFHGTTNC